MAPVAVHAPATAAAISLVFIELVFQPDWYDEIGLWSYEEETHELETACFPAEPARIQGARRGVSTGRRFRARFLRPDKGRPEVRGLRGAESQPAHADP